MSSPISPLDTEAIDSAVADALSAIAAAGNLKELKQARIAHLGDSSPLVLANRAIGSLDKADKATAGRAMGQARGRVNSALAEREEVLTAQRDAEVLRTEAVDVTIPVHRRPMGARHPLGPLSEAVAASFISLGW